MIAINVLQVQSLILIGTMLLCPIVARAQQSKPKPTEDTAQRTKAFELLESLATQLVNLQSTENRARLGANIADSLWTHDEKRARTLFTTVAEDIKLGLAKSYDDKPADFRTAAIFRKLRLDTTERIAKHDAEFALSFLNATEPPPVQNDQYRPSEDQKPERALQVRLANMLAQDNPELAVKLARQSLERGIDRDLVVLLRKLHRKQREAGVALYKEAVAKLTKVNLRIDWQTTSVVVLLVESMPPPLADETSYRQLVNYLITTAIASNCQNRDYHSASYFCNQIRQLSSQMAQVDRQRTSQFVETPNLDPDDLRQMEISHELDEVIQSGGSLNEVLAVAEKYPGTGDWVYQRAVQIAMNDGEIDQARKITRDHIKDSRLRERLFAQITRLSTESTATDEEVEASLREINETENVRSRIEFLRRFASDDGAKNRNRALKILDQAMALTDEVKPNSDQTQLRLDLSVAYCTLKSDRGLALVESEITKLNELIVAATKLDGFDTRYLRDGEWNMSAEGPLGQILTRLSDSASAFAWCDFDRAVNLAAQFERAEIRMMAQIRLAQGILTGPPRRRRMVYFEFVEH